MTGQDDESSLMLGNIPGLAERESRVAVARESRGRPPKRESRASEPRRLPSAVAASELDLKLDLNSLLVSLSRCGRRILVLPMLARTVFFFFFSIERLLLEKQLS